MISRASSRFWRAFERLPSHVQVKAREAHALWTEDPRHPLSQRNFQPGFKTKLHRKDMGIVLNTARELDLALPVSEAVTELMNELTASGGGDLDHSALYTVLEKLGNVETKTPSA